jgi:cytoskeletal protein CcmA (bactofilin family)
MALLTVIGRGVRIHGRVTGDADLTIEGHVEGEVSVSGEVTIDAGALIGANVSGRTITVRGAVRGDLTAEEAVRLEEGARVVGDLKAPRIAIAKGALVRGLVQTGASSGAAPRAKTQASAARPTPVAAAAPARRPAAPASAAQRSAPAPTPKAAATHAARPLIAGAAAVTQATPAHATKGPPPPVVPALKKGAKAALKKKAT